MQPLYDVSDSKETGPFPAGCTEVPARRWPGPFHVSAATAAGCATRASHCRGSPGASFRAAVKNHLQRAA